MTRSSVRAEGAAAGPELDHAPWVGRRLDRIDGPGKVTGHTPFTADQALPDLAHAVLVGASIASGRIRRLDARAAEAAPGVLAVLTYQSADVALKPVKGYPDGPAGTAVLPLQGPDIEQRGQPVAVVVADTPEQAQAAALLLEVEYDEGPLVATLQDGLAGPATGRREAEDLAHHRGHADAGLNTGPVRLDAVYGTPQQNHNPMELHATIVSWDADGGLSVYEPSQWMQSPQHTLATMLELDPERVHVLSPYVGGGFGSKATAWMHVPLTALAARRVGRPVKLVLSRAQMFSGVGYRPATRQTYALGAGADGRVQALTLHADTQTGQSDDFPEQVGTAPKMLYDIPNLRFTQDLVRTHAGGGIMMRAPGEASGSFGLESLMDELAEELGIDPLDLRLLNHAETDPESGKPYSSKHLEECYREGAARFGWARRTPEPGSMRDGQTLIGWGMATAVYPVYVSPATARARLEAGGRVTIEAGTHEIGTGTYTILAQVAADALGVDAPGISVRLGDTHLPKNGYSGGSRTAGSVGSAVQAAAAGLKDELIALALSDPASPLHGRAAAEVRVSRGRMHPAGDPTGGETYLELLARTGKPQLEVYREVVPSGGSLGGLQEMKEGGDGSVEAVVNGVARYSFGAVFAEVRVDKDFMTPRVSRLLGVFDIGRVLNSKTAESQLRGGMIWGLGMALHEGTETDPGTGLAYNANLADYHIPVNADVGTVEAYALDIPDPQATAIGARGAGEIGIVGTAAAIANAVHHATGIRVRDLPITLDKLLGRG